MRIKVTAIENKIVMIPDVFENLEQDSDKQFKMIFRKRNTILDAHLWTTRYADGGFSTDTREFARAHIVKLVNPFELEISNDNYRDVTVDDILFCTFPQLEELSLQTFDKVNQIALMARTDEDIKKS